MITNNKLTTLETSILRVLVYFDLFDHPLREEEISLFLNHSGGLHDISTSLKHLEQRRVVSHIDGYWGFPKLAEKIERRIIKNRYAERRKSAVIKYSKIVASFPFVQAIFLTGSFSKGVMSPDSDIDFFIVVLPGKLWITKALMVIFRKIFLFDSHRNFCINYLVTNDHLQVKDKNIFTATELITMIPVFGHNLYEKLLLENQWVMDYFPRYRKSKAPGNQLQIFPFRPFKELMERILKYQWAERLGDRFMLLSIKQYRKKYSIELTEAEFNTAIVTTKQVSKVHPQFFQKKIIEKYSQKCQKLFQSLEMADS